MYEVVVEGVDLTAVITFSGVELLVYRLLGLLIYFRQHNLARNTFHNSHINPTILHIQLIHENIRRENPKLSLFLFLHLILNQSISNNRYLNILRRYNQRRLSILRGCDRDQVGTVGTKVL